MSKKQIEIFSLDTKIAIGGGFFSVIGALLPCFPWMSDELEIHSAEFQIWACGCFVISVLYTFFTISSKLAFQKELSNELDTTNEKVDDCAAKISYFKDYIPFSKLDEIELKHGALSRKRQLQKKNNDSPKQNKSALKRQKNCQRNIMSDSSKKNILLNNSKVNILLDSSKEEQDCKYLCEIWIIANTLQEKDENAGGYNEIMNAIYQNITENYIHYYYIVPDASIIDTFGDALRKIDNERNKPITGKISYHINNDLSKIIPAEYYDIVLYIELNDNGRTVKKEGPKGEITEGYLCFSHEIKNVTEEDKIEENTKEENNINKNRYFYYKIKDINTIIGIRDYYLGEEDKRRKWKEDAKKHTQEKESVPKSEEFGSDSNSKRNENTSKSEVKEDETKTLLIDDYFFTLEIRKNEGNNKLGNK